MFPLLIAIATAKVVVVPYAPLPGVPEAAAVRATELLRQDLGGRAELQLADLPRSVVKPADMRSSPDMPSLDSGMITGIGLATGMPTTADRFGADRCVVT